MTITDVAGNSRTITEDITIQASTLPLSVGVREASDSATLGDGITTDNEPFLEVIVTPTAAVTVTVTNSSDVLVGTFTTTSDIFGAWSVQLTPALTDDEYTVDVTSVLDDETQSINDFSLVIDTEVTTFTHGLSESTDSGTVGDNITKAPIPEITGQTDPGSNVVVQINGEEY